MNEALRQAQCTFENLTQFYVNIENICNHLAKKNQLKLRCQSDCRRRLCFARNINLISLV
jgi:hypothetical protein